mgnify:CR=1 FL=1
MNHIKIAVSAFLTFLFNNQLNAQQGLEGIIVEKYYVSNAADSVNAFDQLAPYALHTGSITYRIYVDLLPGYRFQATYGNKNHPLIIKTSTNFFNKQKLGHPFLILFLKDV